MPLRVAHVVNEPFGVESANGVQQVVYCLAGAQADIGHSIAVFSREDGVHVLSEGADELVGASRVVVPRGRSLRQRLLFGFLEQKLAGDVLTWRPDIVHFHSVHIPKNVTLAAHLRCAGIPYCVTVHGGLFGPALSRGRLKKSAFSALFERQYLNEARFIHAVSPHETEVIRRWGVDRPIVVVPNGIPPGAHIPPTRPDALYAHSPWLGGRRVFMFIGRLDIWQKGLDLLIDAFARAGLRQAGLVLVGPDCRGSVRALTARAVRHGVSSRLVFTGPAFGDDRANLFAAADVFVHTSRWEGLSLSVLAAAAAGKPCLITRSADPLGELERAQAAIIVEAAVPSIAAGLRRAAALSDDERHVLGSRARGVAAAHFSWPSIAGDMVEAYRSALDSVPSGTPNDSTGGRVVRTTLGPG